MEDGTPIAVPLKDLGARENLLATVWENGVLKRDWSFAEIRARANS